MIVTFPVSVNKFPQGSVLKGRAQLDLQQEDFPTLTPFVELLDECPLRGISIFVDRFRVGRAYDWQTPLNRRFDPVSRQKVRQIYPFLYFRTNQKKMSILPLNPRKPLVEEVRTAFKTHQAGIAFFYNVPIENLQKVFPFLPPGELVELVGNAFLSIHQQKKAHDAFIEAAKKGSKFSAIKAFSLLPPTLQAQYPSYQEYFIDRGVCALRANERDKGYEWLNSITHPVARYNIGCLLLQEHQYEEADKFLQYSYSSGFIPAGKVAARLKDPIYLNYNEVSEEDFV